jgi:polar amino acid transport system substrate-binding protein
VLKLFGFALWALLSAGTLGGEEIRFGFRPMPPYVMVDGTGTYSGLEYDLVVAVLAASGHTVKPYDFPFARLFESIKGKQIQGAAPVLPTHDVGKAYLTDPFITYHNVALALKRRGLHINQVSDLQNLSIMAFQTATQVLGADYEEAVRDNPNYSEMAKQVLQVRTLFAGRIDVAIGETRILHYYIHAPEAEVDTSLPVEEFRIFPPTNYRAAFLEKRHADDFNRGLKTILANGTYRLILLKYSAFQ